MGMDDVRSFFREPSFVHLWFYLLCGVLTLYALNTLWATCKSVRRKWQAGIRSPQFYAASLIHVAFLVGLFAHLVGGLGGAELGQVLVGPNWAALGDGREARVTALNVQEHPDGSTKQVFATLELRGADGRIEETVVRHNGPLSAGFGRELFLLLRAGNRLAADLVRGEARCTIGSEDPCRLGNMEVTLLDVAAAGGPHGAVAHVQLKAESGSRQRVGLMVGRPVVLGDGTALTLAGVERRPAIVLRHRHAPGNPWALLASLLLVTGLLLMWRRLWPARRNDVRAGLGP